MALKKLSRGDQYYNNNRNRFYDRVRSYDKTEIIIGRIRNLGEGTSLETKGVKVEYKERVGSFEKRKQ